jgi:hypothetical protein
MVAGVGVAADAMMAEGGALEGITSVNRIGGGSVDNLAMKAAEKRLSPPGISVLLDTDAAGAAGQMRAVAQARGWPNLMEASKTIGQSTVQRIRDAGFEVMRDATENFPNHGRLFHREGATGFTPENLKKLSKAFEDADVPL